MLKQYVTEKEYQELYFSIRRSQGTTYVLLTPDSCSDWLVVTGGDSLWVSWFRGHLCNCRWVWEYEPLKTKILNDHGLKVGPVLLRDRKSVV